MDNFVESVSPRSLEKALDKCVEMRLETSSDDLFQLFGPIKYDWRDETFLPGFSMF